MQIRPTVAVLSPLLSLWRRQFHQYPELGFREHLTHNYVVERLQQWGWQTERVAKTGVVAVLAGSDPRVLAFRADMDALAMHELNPVPYRSQHPGVMHACGHDGHTAILLGLAKLLAESPPVGTVKLFFQPAEEGPGGALPMIEAGVLENPSPQAIVGLHLWNNLPLGTVGVKSGPMMATSDHFKVTITGRGGHGAMPHQTVDAVVVAAQVVVALQTIVSRNVNPLESAVVTVGQIHAGSAFNVIAPSAVLEGTVRCFTPELATQLPQRLEQVIAGVCQALGASYDLVYSRHYPTVLNHKLVTALVERCATEAQLQVVSEQTMGGEDMAFFLERVPGCYFFLGSANSAEGLDKPHHHPCFDFDEQALTLGVELFARCAEDFFAVPSC
ncbi:M20 family metallopeptidase [Candidatus Cyanaurora vandensis]|uniref:M20 metallopeptidase family protein n=1 Tax=Candidatus Cyanaurora vandensis TaxID=2714958 RepID=UPI00257B5CA7|nr:amidohydrolase [Candidatus Cyanaurora vandensis]